jgi:hypothetical protein
MFPRIMSVMFIFTLAIAVFANPNDKISKNRKKSIKSNKPVISKKATIKDDPKSDKFQLQIKPWGIEQATIDIIRAGVLSELKSKTNSKRIRIISFEMIDIPVNETSKRENPIPTDFKISIFDYQNNRAYQVTGKLDNKSYDIEQLDSLSVSSEEEMQEAISIIAKDSALGEKIRSKSLETFPPMPPIGVAEDVAGSRNRIVNIGMSSKDVTENEVVGVDMIEQKVIRYPDKAPSSCLARGAVCGLPNAAQVRNPRGLAGSYQLSINKGGVQIWSMTITRPSASSGTVGSGIELSSVNYRGKQVLYKAHVPILNVQYAPGVSCGPYRDWQWEEGTFDVGAGTDVVPGIRVTNSRPKSILDSQNDFGNFKGVAVYQEGNEVVLLSELEAGWYRYISEWHFYDNGTILPRFGFGATSNMCVCNVHNHHAYWRFDFDINSSSPNTVYRSNLPITTETNLTRGQNGNDVLMVRNESSQDAYLVIPGVNDGVADPYSVADGWVLNYAYNEIDDGVSTVNSNTSPLLNNFLNGGTVQSADVVLWYTGHFIHDSTGLGSGHENEAHYVGPTLVPVKW